jgi:Fe-coproporphyrin III synthase
MFMPVACPIRRRQMTRQDSTVLLKLQNPGIWPRPHRTLCVSPGTDHTTVTSSNGPRVIVKTRPSVEHVNSMTRAEPTAEGRLTSLPLVTLYLTDRCNSRCVTCDYWRHGRTNMTLGDVSRMLPSLSALGTEVVLLSGGEPLLNPEWAEIAGLLQARGIRVMLLTSGLALAKHAVRAAGLCDSITVSLDGTTRQTYEAIRGLDAYDHVCTGIRAAADAGACVSTRVTVQRANYRELPRFVTRAHELGVQQVSFLAVDVSNPHAFARTGEIQGGLALEPTDLPVLEATLDALARDHAEDFRRRFIAESPQKLRRIHQYFSALAGLADFPEVRCNAPEFSAVVTTSGRVQPCFFIGAPASAIRGPAVDAMLNDHEMQALRAAIRAGQRRECASCVCSMWRDPDARSSGDFLPPRRVASASCGDG